MDDGVAGHCHELHHVGRERHPQEAQPMWTHGVAFCDDERGGVGTGGLCNVRNSSQLHNREAKSTLRDGKTQSVVNGHLEKEEGEERVCWEWWFVTGHVWKDVAQVPAANHGLRW